MRVGIWVLRILVVAVTLGCAYAAAQVQDGPLRRAAEGSPRRPPKVPVVPADSSFVPPGPNIALGKSYKVEPVPNYALTSDDSSRTLLTDGKYTVGHFWTQKTTVGWSNAAPVVITVDLGAVEPIAGIAYDTAAGAAGVTWPTSILVLTSDDGKKWAEAGDLVSLSDKNGPPPPIPYQVHKYATDQLKAHGRFVMLFVQQTPYAFVDEIEVYRGPASLLQAPEGKTNSDPVALMGAHMVINGILARLRADLSAAKDAISRANLSDGERSTLNTAANKLGVEAETMPEDVPAGFRAVFPINDLHRRILTLYAPLHRAHGLPPLTVWAGNRWDMLSPTEAPQKPGPPPTLSVQMMLNEYRGATFNLTNTTDGELNVAINVTGLPGGTNPDYISVREVAFTDTRERIPIADALPEATRSQKGYGVTIPSGMTRQVWLEFRPRTLAAGKYTGEISASPAGIDASQEIGLALRVYPFTFPAMPSIHVGGWDYLDGAGGYDASPGNVAQLIKVLQANYVDSPWAGRGVAPAGASFDGDGKLTSQLNFDEWDQWTGKWPKARLYAVFLAVGDTFSGEKMGTQRFKRMVSEWLVAWGTHMIKQGLRSEQLLLLLSDEPNESKAGETDVIRTWAQAIKSSLSNVTLFEDPTYGRPEAVQNGFWDAVDILCPPLPMFMSAGSPFRSFYMAQQQQGRTLYFYSASGPAKLLDPITYYRGQFWWAARYGAKGSFYWAFGDEGGGSSWNAYAQKRIEYSPLFVAADSVTDAKHMAAIREGAQDYEYFVMLKARIAELEKRGVRSAVLDAAKQLVVQGPETVVAQINAKNLTWDTPKNHEMMDEVRVRVLDMLVELAKL
jgi:hypothetical protein